MMSVTSSLVDPLDIAFELCYACVCSHRCSDLDVRALLVEGVVLVKSVVGGEGEVLDATGLNLREGYVYHWCSGPGVTYTGGV